MSGKLKINMNNGEGIEITILGDSGGFLIHETNNIGKNIYIKPDKCQEFLEKVMMVMDIAIRE